MIIDGGCKQRLLFHRWTGTAVQAKLELLEFLDVSKQPSSIQDLQCRYEVEDLELKLQRLLDMKFVMPITVDEELLYLAAGKYVFI